MCLKYLFLLFVSLLSSNLLAQSIVINKTNSDSQEKDLSSLQKIRFCDGAIVLRFSDNSVEAMPVSEISKILFTNISNSISKLEMNPAVKVFPNPTSDILKINGLEEETEYSIYNLNGTRLLTGKINSGELINVSSFQKGIYILTIKSLTFKVCKQ